MHGLYDSECLQGDLIYWKGLCIEAKVSGFDCNFCYTHGVALGFCGPAGREWDQCGSGQQPLIQETSFLLDTEDFSSGMCRFGFGSSTPKGGVNIWYWTVVLLHDVRWD